MSPQFNCPTRLSHLATCDVSQTPFASASRWPSCSSPCTAALRVSKRIEPVHSATHRSCVLLAAALSACPCRGWRASWLPCLAWDPARACWTSGPAQAAWCLTCALPGCACSQRLTFRGVGLMLNSPRIFVLTGNKALN